MALPTIFVQIAAYRDPECQWTVSDLFSKAAHPERVHVGICWQSVPTQDQPCFQFPIPHPTQVRLMEVDAKDSRGVCWARSEVQKLWQGEEFTLQIDSHMRFEPGWDESLIAMFQSRNNPKTVLSSYPAAYTPPDEIPRRVAYHLVAREFDKNGILRISGAKLDPTPSPAKLIPGAFIGACMLFGRGELVHEVPYDPHLYFFGEEITLSVRLWTHGYDIYHPSKPIMYHYWERKGRPTHVDDHEQWRELDRRSIDRVHKLLAGDETIGTQAMTDAQQFGLGTMRSLKEYEAYAGVDFMSRRISQAAHLGRFPAGTTTL